MATKQKIKIITEDSGTETLEIYDVDLDPGGKITKVKSTGFGIINKTKTKPFKIRLTVEYNDLRWLEAIKNRSEEFKFILYTLDEVYNGTAFIVGRIKEDLGASQIKFKIAGDPGDFYHGEFSP